MILPFTNQQFFEVIEKYNIAVFPIQIVIEILGIICLYFLFSGKKVSSKYSGGFLAFLWLWSGIAYHLLFFTGINKAAYLFGFVFILQGIMFLINTLSREALEFKLQRNLAGYTAFFFIVYALLIYPVISFFVEGSLGKTIVLGLPCPSTILTFGFLMLVVNRLPKYLMIIPSLWAIVGLSAAINLGVYQDLMIIASAVVASVIVIGKHKTETVKPN